METRENGRVGQQRPVDLLAGAAVIEITPPGRVFLYGYPHVPRTSTGVHDPLECAALYLRSGTTSALFIANDLIFITKEMAVEVRRRLAAETGVPAAAIMLTATHTHSGPVIADCISNAGDPVVPRADGKLIEWLVTRIVEAATAAVRAAVLSEIGLSRAIAEGVGTNRHDPAGPTDTDVPVLLVRSRAARIPLACMIVYGMHPTVLHEDSTLVSGDFVHFTRRWLRGGALPPDCPVLFHQGASGNQSPRHVTRANTFAEAQRLGEILGRSVADVIKSVTFSAEATIFCRQNLVELEPRAFPKVEAAQLEVARATARYNQLAEAGAPRQQLRTAECDVFGAEETAELSRAASDGRLARAIAACTPAEIQVIRIGQWTFVGWPGEFFVEYALQIKARARDTFIITLANGELQGYIVTPEAVGLRVYESNNAVFAPDSGKRFVDATLTLLGNSS